ncbi:MAG: efflux RND transporter permease subunit [Myxococcales bacterium]|nr:efflux RND transporter permease subunit [Myxococcales bacterium]
MMGLVSWMANNRVAANLLMVLLLLGGWLSASNTQQEVFPEFALDAVYVSVAYPGASPAEVEQGVLLALEGAVSGIEGVDEVMSIAEEGSGQVVVWLLTDADRDEVLRDVEQAVDRVTTLPDDAEEPVVTELSRRSRVITVAVSGAQQLDDLLEVADRLEDELVAHRDVSLVEVSGAPDREVAIEIDRATLQAYGLTLDEVARQIAVVSLERPAGSVQTTGGDLRVRVSDRSIDEIDFTEIAVRTNAQGATVRLGDIATITSGFAEEDAATWLDGERSLRVDAYRIGEERPAQVAAATRQAVATLQGELPDTVSLTVLSDDSQALTGRLQLLAKNALQGLLLVFAALALFLDLRTAGWVAAGIPIAFLGAFLVLPALGVSVNMISLFALLVVLGLVVDDAIVVGEQIYYEQEQLHAGAEEEQQTQASVRGAMRMVGPVVVAVLTTIFAFAPMLGVPGVFGKIFWVFPVVVASVLLFSLVEAFLILPAHLSHRAEPTAPGRWSVERWVGPVRRRVSGGLQRFVKQVYEPGMRRLLPRRGAVLGASLGLLALVAGVIAGGWVPVQFFPDIPGSRVTATVSLPAGSADGRVESARLAVEQAAREALSSTGASASVQGIVTRRGVGDSGGDELVVEIHVDEDTLVATPAEIEAAWGSALPPLDGVRSVVFEAAAGPAAGDAVDVTLRHTDDAVLAAASESLGRSLAEFADLTDVSSSLASSTPQLDVRVNELGTSLGLSSEELAAQVRSAYQGAEALREQEGRRERTVRVRLPLRERTQQAVLEGLPVRVGSGDYVALSDVAELSPSRAAARIDREDGARLVHVTASLAPGVSSSSDVMRVLQSDVLPALEAQHRGLQVGMAGQTQEMSESLGALIPLGGLALVGIFALLASTFRSYVQPVVVMSAIPFGVVGAVAGHALMGIELSMISLFGIIALAGVVVNDSLVLVDAANERRAAGAGALDAIVAAGSRRMRPILLTSLTTFLGLAPMLLETSVQAQFLIPMAVSLGFGILFATGVVLVLVPAFYLLVEDARVWSRMG